MITELRRYRIKPGCMESWLAFFAGAAREHVRLGIRVEYAGVDHARWSACRMDEVEPGGLRADRIAAPVRSAPRSIDGGGCGTAVRP